MNKRSDAMVLAIVFPLGLVVVAGLAGLPAEATYEPVVDMDGAHDQAQDGDITLEAWVNYLDDSVSGTGPSDPVWQKLRLLVKNNGSDVGIPAGEITHSTQGTAQAQDEPYVEWNSYGTRPWGQYGWRFWYQVSSDTLLTVNCTKRGAPHPTGWYECGYKVVLDSIKVYVDGDQDESWGSGTWRSWGSPPVADPPTYSRSVDMPKLPEIGADVEDPGPAAGPFWEIGSVYVEDGGNEPDVRLEILVKANGWWAGYNGSQSAIHEANSTLEFPIEMQLSRPIEN